MRVMAQRPDEPSLGGGHRYIDLDRVVVGFITGKFREPAPYGPFWICEEGRGMPAGLGSKAFADISPKKPGLPGRFFDI